MKKAIVIGATSGIGQALAKLLIHDDYMVGITGRRAELLEHIKAESPNRYLAKTFDVTDHRATIHNLELFVHEFGIIDLVIISAGTGDLNEPLDFAIEQQTIDTNVSGFTNIADWAFNQFMKQQSGQLVAISSIGGLRGSRHAPAYNASKAYQINYLEGLRQKAWKTRLPITITDIRPGLVDTNMAKGEGLFWMMPVEKTARQIFRGIKRKKNVVYVTKRWRILAWISRQLPRTVYQRM